MKHLYGHASGYYDKPSELNTELLAVKVYIFQRDYARPANL